MESTAAVASQNPTRTEAVVCRTVGLGVARSIVAYGERQYHQASERLLAARDNVIKLGGSHAQRDVFEGLLIDTALRDRNWSLAEQLLSQRYVPTRPRKLMHYLPCVYQNSDNETQSSAGISPICGCTAGGEQA